MPIKFENKSKYPPDWKSISLRIRARAGWRCEWCGAENSQPHPVTGSRVVLTVAHYPDDNPANCADDNLLALCQKCHNTLDAPLRARHRKETLRTKRHRGQLSLFDGLD